MFQTYSAFSKQQIRLSYPIVLGQLTSVLIAVADGVMVGNYDNTALAAAAFTNGVIFIFATFGIGLTFGLKPLVASAFSSTNYERCAALLQNGLVLYTFVGTLMWLGYELAIPLFSYLNQPSEVITLAVPYYRLIALSIIPWFVFLALQQFSEALYQTKIPMLISIFSCVINIVLNYVLIFGKVGFPELGLVGAGLATLISRVLSLFLMVMVFLTLPFFRKFVRLSFSFSKEIVRKLANIGVPIGMNMVFESAAFGVAAIMAGWISEEALAAHQIALNVSFTTFMVALGLSQGTTVSIATLVGKNRWQDIKPMGRSAVMLVIFFMMVMAILILTFQDYIPSWYINETEPNAVEIVQLTTALLVIVAIYQLADGVQVVSAGNLRGLEDTKVPTLIGLFSYWIVGIPSGYLMAFVFDFGVKGIWWGLCLGLFWASALLTWRFEKQTKTHSAA